MRFILAATLVFLITFPAVAQSCKPRADVLATLAIAYDERVLLIGLAADDKTVIEVFSSPHGETFTLLVTRNQDGQLCSIMIGAGHDLRPMPFAPGNPS